MSNYERNTMAEYLNSIGGEHPLSDEEEQRLARRIEQGDGKAVNALVMANLKFVVFMAKQYAGRGLGMDDLVAEGNVALLKSAAKYHSNRGKRFALFAAPYLREAFENAIRVQNGLYKVPDSATKEEKQRSRAKSIDAPIPEGSQNTITLLSVVQNNEAQETDRQLIANMLLDDTQQAMNALLPREREVMSRIYGIGTHPETMAEVALQMGVTRERVRQIRNKAIRRLRKIDLMKKNKPY